MARCPSLRMWIGSLIHLVGLSGSLSITDESAPFITFTVCLLCQEPDEVMFSFFCQRLPVEVAKSKPQGIKYFWSYLMNSNLYKYIRPNGSIRCDKVAEFGLSE